MPTKKTNQKHRLYRFFLLLATAAAALLFGCGSSRAEDVLCETSIFSWEATYITEEKEDLLAKAMDALSCRTIYQHIPKATPEPLVLDYLARRRALGQYVFYLAGEPEWAVEPDARHMKEAIQTVSRWNEDAQKEHAEEEIGFAGIVWDIEPYLLDTWEDDPRGHLEQFAANCAGVYDLAHRQDLFIIICIPNFYDRISLEEPLESLIQSGCDAVAVMNYDKTDESGQIAVEAILTARHDKALIHITELQKPGYHQLTEKNTYYYDGFQAVEESWDRLRKEYPDSRLGFSWHYLKPVLELMEKEG